MLDIEVRGTNRVRNSLRKLAVMHPELTDPVIGKHAKAEQKALRNTPYPPRPPLSTYIRKRFFGGIAGSFSALREGAGVWKVKNSRPYAAWVIGDKGAWPGQTLVHQRNNWWTMRDEIQKRIPELTAALSMMLEQELNE